MKSKSNSQGSKKKNRLLPLIGIEHVIVGLILLGVGVVLLFNADANVGKDITSLAKTLGIDPASNGVQGLLGSAKKVTSSKLVFYGIVSAAFGLLQVSEGTGLILRKRWGEYLTVVSTLLLFIPDIYELVTKPGFLKLGAFILNVAMITYLTIHLRRTRGEGDTKRDVPFGSDGYYPGGGLTPARSR